MHHVLVINSQFYNTSANDARAAIFIMVYVWRRLSADVMCRPCFQHHSRFMSEPLITTAARCTRRQPTSVSQTNGRGLGANHNLKAAWCKMWPFSQTLRQGRENNTRSEYPSCCTKGKPDHTFRAEEDERGHKQIKECCRSSQQNSLDRKKEKGAATIMKSCL